MCHVSFKGYEAKYDQSRFCKMTLKASSHEITDSANNADYPQQQITASSGHDKFPHPCKLWITFWEDVFNFGFGDVSHTRRIWIVFQVIKKKSLKGQETIEGQVTREVIVDAVARQCKVQMVPDFLEMNKPILKHGVYDIPVGILKPDGSQAVLELHVKVPKKQRRLYR